MVSDRGRRHAPPEPHWRQPGSAPRPAVGVAAAQRIPAPGAAQAASAPVTAQPAKTFGALRTARTGGQGSADELVALRGDEFHLKTGDRGLLVRPSGTYNFVRVQGKTRGDASTYVSNRSGHAQLAGGKPVIYAGTARFEGGRLDWWSNYSGTYQPLAAFSDQARLPQEKFVPWQRLQMGGQAMQRGMFADRRPTAAPTPPDPRRTAAPETSAVSVGSKPTEATPAATTTRVPAARSFTRSPGAATGTGTAATAPTSAPAASARSGG